jgi:predicted nucleic acid-binding protein
MLDTNVLISAIVFPNDRMNSLIYKATLDHQLVLFSYTIDELLDVVKRKFSAKVKDANLFLARLPYELVYSPIEQNHDLFNIRDEDDYSVLYSAIIEDVDLCVTVMMILMAWKLINQRLSLRLNLLKNINSGLIKNDETIFIRKMGHSKYYKNRQEETNGTLYTPYMTKPPILCYK